MKQRIWTNRIPVSALIALVGLGIGISCSKDASVSNKPPRAGKAAVPTSVDFHPQKNVNYDPFDGMGEDGRKDAIGGREAAEKYLRVLVAQLANAMQKEQTRRILQKVVPTVNNGRFI